MPCFGCGVSPPFMRRMPVWYDMDVDVRNGYVAVIIIIFLTTRSGIVIFVTIVGIFSSSQIAPSFICRERNRSSLGATGIPKISQEAGVLV